MTNGTGGQGPCRNVDKGGGGGSFPEVFEKDQYYYHPDHFGSSSYVTDLDGEISQHLEYFPFGETWVEESSNTQRTPYLFTAKELDEETGLYYFGARYYDPRTSVWQSPDPILKEYLPNAKDLWDAESNEPEVVRPGASNRFLPKFADLPGDGGVYAPQNLNLYAYSHNSPIVKVDNDGNAAGCAAGAGAGAVFGGVGAIPGCGIGTLLQIGLTALGIGLVATLPGDTPIDRTPAVPTTLPETMAKVEEATREGRVILFHYTSDDIPFLGDRVQNFVAVHVTGLPLETDPNRPGVFLVPNEGPLPIAGRLVGAGPNE